jgi:hypothetical protein
VLHKDELESVRKVVAGLVDPQPDIKSSCGANILESHDPVLIFVEISVTQQKKMRKKRCKESRIVWPSDGHTSCRRVRSFAVTTGLWFSKKNFIVFLALLPPTTPPPQRMLLACVML